MIRVPTRAVFGRRIRWAARALGAAAPAAALALAHSATAAAQSWDMTSLAQYVQPMQHAMGSQMPILAWNLPLPDDDTLASMRNDGTLRADAVLLWSRGIAPTVNLAFGTRDGANAMAATLQEAGIPIHLFANPPAWQASWTTTGRHAYDYWPAGSPYWFNYSTNGGGDLWPAFPLASPTGGYAGLKEQLRQLQLGHPLSGLPGIPAVKAMWMDFESLPGAYGNLSWVQDTQSKGAMADGRAVASTYDDPTVPFPGNGKSVNQTYGYVFDNSKPLPLVQYVADLARWLLDQSGRKALNEVYGTNTWFGNFGDLFSSVRSPTCDVNSSAVLANQPPLPGTAAMPIVYANNIHLGWYLGTRTDTYANCGGQAQVQHHPPSQANADDAYWYFLLRTFSTSARNGGETGRSVAWVTQWARDDPSGSFDYPMTVSLYQELLRHIWLRGVMGMYVFNPYHTDRASIEPYSSGADYSFKQLEYVRAVLDEMLSFRGFLARGTPMNLNYNPVWDHGPVWSGLALNGQAVVRTVSPNGTTGTIASIAVPGGASFTNLVAPADGATYLLGPGSARHRVDSRPAALYLKLERNYEDSSGSHRKAVPGHYPSSLPEPTFAADVPSNSGVVSVLNGSYGLYANQRNQYSLSLSGADPQHPDRGNYLSVTDTNDVFNAASFTVEAFVNVGSGSPDRASLLSKGRRAGAYDWQLQYRSNGQAQIQLSLVNGTTYFLRSTAAVLPASGWHHVAFTYDASRDASSPTITLYVDHIKAPWGSSSDGNLTGRLPLAMSRSTGDGLVLGYFTRGLIGSVDEVRFTPEVLDPLQMLVNAALR